MQEDDLQNTLAWLSRVQGIKLDADEVADPADAAARLGQLAQEESRHLPFESEPSQFVKLLHDLAPKDLSDD